MHDKLNMIRNMHSVVLKSASVENTRVMSLHKAVSSQVLEIKSAVTNRWTLITGRVESTKISSPGSNKS